MKVSQKIILFSALVVALLAADRITKNLAKAHLMYQPDISYFHNTLILEYVENTGAALSLGDNLPKPVSFWLLSIIPLGIIVWLGVFTFKNIKELNTLKLVSFALVFAGGLGNIADRILFDRHVTDFINIGIGNIRTGIFNVADMGVTAGAIGLVITFMEKQPAPISAPPTNTPDSTAEGPKEL